MEELARARRGAAGETIVVRERTGEPYGERYMSGVHRAICEKAGLPKDVAFTRVGHGGIAEEGSIEADVRPIPGRATLHLARIQLASMRSLLYANKTAVKSSPDGLRRVSYRHTLA